MAQGANFTCPNCGERNFVAFAKIKKNLQGNVSFTAQCGCNLSPDEVIEELRKSFGEEFRKKNPELFN